MFTVQIFKFSTFGAILLLLNLIHYCFCEISTNGTGVVDDNGFPQAVATWYGNPNGPGSTGGACGFGEDVGRPPFNAMISAGGPVLYKSGKGCGSCYQVKCTQNSACSGKPVTVTIADECPGCTDGVHFDLSGVAFGALAKPGQADKLRNDGKITVQYQRTPCRYNVGLTFKIDLGSNPFYLAFAIEYVPGDGGIGFVEILSPNNRGWWAMQQSFGATWKINLPGGARGPFSVKITMLESKRKIIASNVIPANWAPGRSYHA